MRPDYKYHEVDKVMSYKVDAIYSNPNRHKFFSCFDMDETSDRRGKREGIIRGPKRKCYFCGQVKSVHADKTEEL